MDNIDNGQNPIKNLDEFIQKVSDMKKQDKMDLSSDEDLSLAIMNLVSIEEHFFFSGAKGEEKKYYGLLNEAREMRKELMKKIEKNPAYEEHCIMKHLLAGSMRLMEVGTKQLGMDKKEEAYYFFEKAYNLYSLFWGINLGAIVAKDIKKIDDGALDKGDKESILAASQTAAGDSGEKGLMGKLGKIIKKIVDCCIE
ncbi:MAG: hypothetical protein HYT36_03330 [Candidatus Staskawiczbacteria bacterium]|nr:hypothetical protein [Candidatus Staskawiczbacteria bacterium]